MDRPAEAPPCPRASYNALKTSSNQTPRRNKRRSTRSHARASAGRSVRRPPQDKSTSTSVQTDISDALRGLYEEDENDTRSVLNTLGTLAAMTKWLQLQGLLPPSGAKFSLHVIELHEEGYFSVIKDTLGYPEERRKTFFDVGLLPLSKASLNPNTDMIIDDIPQYLHERDWNNDAKYATFAALVKHDELVAWLGVPLRASPSSTIVGMLSVDATELLVAQMIKTNMYAIETKLHEWLHERTCELQAQTVLQRLLSWHKAEDVSELRRKHSNELLDINIVEALIPGNEDGKLNKWWVYLIPRRGKSVDTLKREVETSLARFFSNSVPKDVEVVVAQYRIGDTKCEAFSISA